MEIYSGNPALLHLQLGHWLAANPWLVLMALALTAAGGVCLVFKPLLGLALLVTTMIYTGQELRSARQKFYKGNVCPGVVLSARQNLVAVYADLTTTDHGHYPAIQILKQPLHRMTTGRACDGMRVAAAALYFGELKNPAWTNFWPEVIPCVIHDPDENARVFDSIAEAEWRMLEACLAQVPNPTLGLHRIRNLPGGNGNGSGNGWADEALWIPPRPWFKSPAALFAFVALGLVAVVSAAVFVVGALERKRHPREPQFMRPTLASPALQPAMPAPSHPQPGIAQPPTTAPHFPRPAQPTQTGPYVAGGLVEARWAGGWIRGKIDSINPGGFTVRVQLEDARFPHPIVLPTNQIRLP